MKHHPLTAASSADQQYVEEQFKEAKKKQQKLRGYWYHLASFYDSEGYSSKDATLFVPINKVNRKRIDAAILHLKMEVGAEHTTVLVIPAPWLKGRKTAA